MRSVDPHSVHAAALLQSALPSDWASVRLKFLLSSPITDGPHLTPEFISEGFPFLSVDGIQNGELEFEGCRFISKEDHNEFSRKASPRRDDILLGKAASTGKIARVKVDIEFSIWSPLALIRADKGKISSSFLEYCLKSTLLQSQIDDFCSSNTQKNISMGDIPKLTLPLPSLDVQHSVANYLDRETARIDELIAEKERMLALLDEKRSALISRVVTRGLDPSAPLKPSGKEWLGEIPAHWRLERMKFHLLRLEQGWSPQCDNYMAEPDNWGVLKAGAVNDWTFNPSENKRLPGDVEPIYQYAIKLHDVLMSRANTSQLLGSIVYVGDIPPKLLLCDKLYRLHVDDRGLNREFLVAFLRARPGRFQLERDASGTSGSMQNIGQDTVENLWIAIPPLDEQERISRVITDTRKEIKKMDEALRRSVDLLRERRAALISAAVTGQIPLGKMEK